MAQKDLCKRGSRADKLSCSTSQAVKVCGSEPEACDMSLILVEGLETKAPQELSCQLSFEAVSQVLLGFAIWNCVPNPAVDQP